MQEHELYKKYRQLIEELANKRHSRDRSLTDLHALLQRFASEATHARAWRAQICFARSLPTSSSMKPFAPPARIGATCCWRAVKGFDAHVVSWPEQ